MEISNYAIEQEIIRLHFFFENWFNATSLNAEEAFQNFSASLASTFVIIGPDGSLTPKTELTEHLYRLYGARPGIRISIHNPKVHRNENNFIVATYEEWQLIDFAEKKRLSSVLFEFKDERLIWQHVHETWLT